MGNISQAATLKVLEVLANRVGVKLKDVKVKDAQLYDLMQTVGEAFEKVLDAAELEPEQVGERLMDLSAISVIAVASMVAGVATETGEKIEEVNRQGVIDIEAAAQRAKQLMIDRAKNSNIVISSFDQFD